jgi:uncharacterized membrane protein
MSEQRIKDRFGGVIVGIPMVAIPVRISQWSPLVGAIMTLVLVSFSIAYVFGFTGLFDRAISKLVDSFRGGL